MNFHLIFFIQLKKKINAIIQSNDNTIIKNVDKETKCRS